MATVAFTGTPVSSMHGDVSGGSSLAICLPAGASGLQSLKQFFVFSMSADPKPHDHFVVDNAYRSIVDIDSYRVNRFSRVNTLELQARMIGIIPESGVSGPGLPLYFSRQGGISLPEFSGGM